MTPANLATTVPATSQPITPPASTPEASDVQPATLTVRPQSIPPTSIPVKEQSGLGTVRLLTGHGGFNWATNQDRTFDQLRQMLEVEGYVVEIINPSEEGIVSPEAKLIVIAGTETPFTREEVNDLRSFVGTGGSLVVLAEPVLSSQLWGKVDPLAEYLETFWGMKLGDDFVIEPGQAPLVSSGGFASHPITNQLERQAASFHSARSVTALSGTAVTMVELVKAPEQAWAETDMAAVVTGIAAGALANSSYSPQDTAELPGPVTLAIAGVDVTGTRVAVFGDADFASDAYIQEAGNGNLILQTIHWAMDAKASTVTATTPQPLPTGKWIAFASQENDGWGLYLVQPDGSNLTRLEGELDLASEVTRTGVGLAWSPDGQMLVFQAETQNNQDIFIADIRQGNLRRLAGTGEDDWYPTWDSKGEWIAFASRDRIMRVRPDGTGLQTVVNAVLEIPGVGELPAYATHPAFSPDNRYLVFSSGNDQMIGTYDIAVLDTTLPDKKPSILFHHPNANDFSPAFAPTGIELAFISAQTMDYDFDLFFTDLQSDPVKISNHVAQFPFPFSWSPDGDRIAYSVQIGERSEIFVVRPVEGNPVQLTGQPLSGETIGYREDGSRAPAWSPDGAQLVFQSNRDGNWEIYVMHADGSEQTNITNSSAQDISPVWQP
jgi:TolB protein